MSYYDRLQYLHEMIIKKRLEENKSFWYRNNFYLLVNSGIFVFLGREFIKEDSLSKGHLDMLSYLSIFGIAFSLIWFLTNNSAIGWMGFHRRWESEIGYRLCPEARGFYYTGSGTVLGFEGWTERYHWFWRPWLSVTKLARLLSFFFVMAWAQLLFHTIKKTSCNCGINFNGIMIFLIIVLSSLFGIYGFPGKMTNRTQIVFGFIVFIILVFIILLQLLAFGIIPCKQGFLAESVLSPG